MDVLSIVHAHRAVGCGHRRVLLPAPSSLRGYTDRHGLKATGASSKSGETADTRNGGNRGKQPADDGRVGSGTWICWRVPTVADASGSSRRLRTRPPEASGVRGRTVIGEDPAAPQVANRSAPARANAKAARRWHGHPCRKGIRFLSRYKESAGSATVATSTRWRTSTTPPPHPRARTP